MPIISNSWNRPLLQLQPKLRVQCVKTQYKVLSVLHVSQEHFNGVMFCGVVALLTV